MIKFRSLELNLIVLSALILLGSMAVAWFGLVRVFERHVEQRVHAELDNHIKQLIVNFKRDDNGEYRLENPLSNPRFRRPFSGLYWQIDDENGTVLKSRSLWDTTLKFTISSSASGIQEYNIPGPQGNLLFSVVENFNLNTGEGEKWYRFSASLDHSEISVLVEDFSFDLLIALFTVALIFVLALIVLISLGFRPLERLSKQINELRHGKRERLDYDLPSELQPVVQEINHFLDVQARVIERGRMRAGNLAHGFKTPLSILSTLVRQLEKDGRSENAQLLKDQLNAMGRHVDHELARAKIPLTNPSGGNKTQIHVATAKIVKALEPRSREKNVEWTINIPNDLLVSMETGDFVEVVGNLLENACKWAKKHIYVRARKKDGGTIIMEIEDDGPGVDEKAFSQIVKRGIRLDQSKSGTGFGLAIVHDLLEVYGYHFDTYSSVPGGLGIRIEFG